jgi:hypothetical protein
VPRDLFEENGITANTTPRDLFSVNNIPIQSPMDQIPQNQSMPIDKRIAADVLAGFAQMGHGILNTPSNIAQYLSKKDLISPETANLIPRQKDYDYSAMLGLPNPSTADKALQSVAQYAPLIPFSELKAANTLAGGVFGATQNENPASGFIEGALGQTIPAAAFKGITKIPKALENFHPQKLANAILEDLGKGKSVPKTIENMVEKLKSSYSIRKAGSDKIFSPVNTKHNNKYIDEYLDNYLGLDKDIEKYFTPSLRKMNDAFLNKPTFKNAHDLQSQLGYEIRDLEKQKAAQTLDTAGKNQLEHYRETRDSLVKDIKKYFERKDPKSGQVYKKGLENWQKEIVPYYSDPLLAKIVQGKVKNPGNEITNIFKNPEENIQKVVKDVGPDLLDSLAYVKIGELSPNTNAENIAKAMHNYYRKDYSQYITPKFKNQYDLLNKRIKYAHYIKKVPILSKLSDLVEGSNTIEAGDLAKSLYEMNQ